MGAYTSTQAGNWSADATWGGGGHPVSGDTATTGHAVTVDVDSVCDGVTMNAGGHVTVATTKKLIVNGTLWQKDATVQLNAGAKVWGNGKWLQGSANSQLNCRVVSLGNGGSICEIKASGGTFYVDGGEEGGSPTFGNCGGWDCAYTTFTGLGHPTLAWSIRSNDFGLHHRRFDHCTFDNCKTQFAVTYNWGANGSVDWIVRYCRWQNQPALAAGMRYYFSGTTTGSLTFDHNVVDEPADQGACITLTPVGANINDNYFDSCPAFGGAVYASFLRNVIRYGSRPPSIAPSGGLVETYLLADHVDPADRVLGTANMGNPHFLSGIGAGDYRGNVMEYPHELVLDGGEAFYGGTLGASTIQENLVLASMTDGYKSADLTNPGNVTDWLVAIEHNTQLGKTGTLAFLGENAIGHTCILSCKSNIVQGETAGSFTTACAGAYDITLAASDVDLLDPAQIRFNYLHNYTPFTDSGGGGAWTNTPHDGWRCHLTSVPDGTNIYVNGGSGPDFVDNTRCAARWAVYKAAVGAEPTKPALPVNRADAGWITWLTWKRDALDAVRTLLRGDPTLGHSDLRVWVRAGFVPQNAALDGTAHDGGTIGAMPFGASAPPPAVDGFFKALGR